MGNFLYIVAIFLVIAWIIGYFGTNAGNMIHILLVIAVVAVYTRITQKPKVV
jgi:hypothetical protein